MEIENNADKFYLKNNVFTQYFEKYKFEDNYVLNLDGIVNETLYNEAPVKIMCLFKECYRGEKNDYKNCYIYPLNQELNEYEPWKMWKPAQSWTDVIFKNYDNTTLNNSIKYTAVCNIIKDYEVKEKDTKDGYLGNSRTTYKRLKEKVKADYLLLNQQIDDIKPEIIICGNTFSLYVKIKYLNQVEFTNYDDFKKNNYTELARCSSGGIYCEKNTKKLIFDFYHPSSYKTKANHVEELLGRINLKSLVDQDITYSI